MSNSIRERDLSVTSPAPVAMLRAVQDGESINVLLPEINNAAALLTDGLNGAVAAAQADIAPVIAGLGYEPPVAFAAGLAITSTRQTVSYEGAVYAPVQDALPFTTTGSFAPSQWRVIQGITGADLGAATGARMVGFGDATVDTALKAALPVPVGSVALIAAAGLAAGARCQVLGTVFEIRAEKPLLGSCPLIPAGSGLWAVPVANVMTTNYGTLIDKGAVTAAGDWSSASSRQLQGSEFDNRAGTLIMASLDTTTTPAVGKLIEYAYSGAGIGAEVMRTGTMPLGHAEYFALEYDSSGGRHLWVGGNNSATIRRFALHAGATAADQELSVDISAVTADLEPKVWAHDERSLKVRCTRIDTGVDTIHICRIADLLLGTFAPVAQYAASKDDNLYPILPTQNTRGFGDALAGVSGYALTSAYKAAAAWVDGASGALLGQMSLQFGSATADDEIEGVGLWWDAAHAKFVTHASVWRSTGTVYMLSLTEPTKLTRLAGLGEFSYMETYATAPMGEASQQAGYSRRRVFPMPLFTTAVFIGGEDRSVGSAFDPGDFFWSQYQNNGTRQGLRGRFYKSSELKVDGPADTAFPEGMRYFIGSFATSMHLVGGGARFGGQYSKGYTGAYGAVHAIGNATKRVGGQFSSYSASYPALYLQASMDIACPTGEALGFGTADPAAGTLTSWYTMTGTYLAPATDNSRTFGAPGLRISVLHAASSTINTSDAREKTDVTPLSEAELAASVALSREIGWFKFLSAIEEKGEAEARQHVGMTVQRAIEVMQAHGLDAFAWGFICYDAWDELPEIVETWEASPAVMDENGNVLEEAREAGSAIKQAYRPAGDRYSFRMSELLAFIARGQAQRQDALEARLAALEAAAGEG